ncbi:MAG: response regulator transcription factor [Sandaracinus sp.]|nr:response regulator transcription factor [Sandaracinus sp.]MCB9633234.1 response regulator transcription factor [Sandaracinus sp.]
MTRVYVADDHPIVRRGIIDVLQEVGGFEVVGQADDGLRVLNDPDLARAQVVVLDLSLPRLSGTEVLRRLRAERPELSIVVLSSHPEDQFASRCLAEGASFYVSKDHPPAALLAAIKDAAAGKRADYEEQPAPHTTLSRREQQVFLLIVSGRSVSEIAAELHIESCTVSNHLAKVRDKLGVQTATDMVKYAYATGLIAEPPR